MDTNIFISLYVVMTPLHSDPDACLGTGRPINVVVVVVLGFYVPPTAKGHTQTGPRFKVSSERLEKPGIELTTPGLQGDYLNHYTTEASGRLI